MTQTAFFIVQVAKAAEEIEKRGERPNERIDSVRQSGRVRLRGRCVDTKRREESAVDVIRGQLGGLRSARQAESQGKVFEKRLRVAERSRRAAESRESYEHQFAISRKVKIRSTESLSMHIITTITTVRYGDHRLTWKTNVAGSAVMVPRATPAPRSATRQWLMPRNTREATPTS